MNEKLQSDLVKAYPNIFKNIGGDKTVTCMHWGIECNDGWYDLIYCLCHSIQRHCQIQTTRYIHATDKYEFLVEGDPEYVQVVAAQVEGNELNARGGDDCGHQRIHSNVTSANSGEAQRLQRERRTEQQRLSDRLEASITECACA